MHSQHPLTTATNERRGATGSRRVTGVKEDVFSVALRDWNVHLARLGHQRHVWPNAKRRVEAPLPDAPNQ